MGDWSRLLTVFSEVVEALLGMEESMREEEEEEEGEVEEEHEEASTSRLREDSLLRAEWITASFISRPLNLTD